MIRFHEAILVRFGKFLDYSISFCDGLQMIYGENEAGKSTLQLFFKVMLYGISGNKKDNKGLKIRERIIPWEEKSAEGILRVNINDRLVEIRRKFGKTASGDKTEIVDFHTGDPVLSINCKNIGEELLGIPESVFEKTLWVQQGNVSFSGTDDTMNSRLMNLLETGTEEVSVDQVLKYFDAEKKAIKAKDKRSNPGELDVLWRLREQKVQEKYKILSERGQREAEENVLKQKNLELKKLKQEEERLQKLQERRMQISALESRRKKWEEARKFLAFAEQIEKRETYQRFHSLDETLVQNAENLEKRIETLDQTTAVEYDIKGIDNLIEQKSKQERIFVFLTVFGIFFISLSFIFALLNVNVLQIPAIIMGTCGIASTIVGIMKNQNIKTVLLDKIAERENLSQELARIKLERSDIHREYLKILSAYQCKNAAELREGFMFCKQAEIERDGYVKTYESLLEGENIDALSEEVQEIDQVLAQNQDILELDVENELQKVRKKQLECVSEIKETESKLSYVFRDYANAADIETEIQQINQKIDNLEKRQKALELAAEIFEEVAEKRKSDFTPMVNEKVNYFLDILTGGKYLESRVSKEYQLRLLPEKNHMYQAEFFSSGTYEQIYFALRLSLTSLIGDGTEPLFLDDLLTLYDDKRAEFALDLLMELAKKHQIFLFGCHGREVENLKKRNVCVRYLEEE